MATNAATSSGDLEERQDFEKFCLSKVANRMLYIPNFITKAEEQQLLGNVYSAPKPKWTVLSNRRLQNWGGLPHPKGMIVEALPEWLLQCCQKIGKLDLYDGKPLNHVLVNEYTPGQGIMAHTDGPLYYPVVCTISLGSHTVIDFYKRRGEQADLATCSDGGDVRQRHVTSLLLEPCSLFVVSQEMYSEHEHEIGQRSSDVISADIGNLDLCSNVSVGDVLERGTRVSLTIRHVPKTLKTKIFLRR